MDKKTFKDIALLFGVIVVAAVGARALAGGETLSDYAKKNPEVAWVTIEQTGTATEANSDDNTKEKSADSSESVLNKEKQDDTSVYVKTNGAEMSNSNIKADSSENISKTGTGSNSTKDDNMVVNKDYPTGNNSENSLSSDNSTEETSDTSTASNSSTTDLISSTTGDSKTSSATSENRTTYKDGFYYEPISNSVFSRISGISYPVDCTVPLDELRYVVVQYVDFNENTQSGELICNKALAQDMVEIFYELYTSGYQIESIKLVDEFNGDDTASMLANNTSCFNYRVVEGTTRLSNHALGRAIDINPFYNPYITYNKDGTTRISPVGSEPYADRTAQFPYKIDENDLAYKLFKAHGFKWGGNWNSSKDYQHFEKK